MSLASSSSKEKKDSVTSKDGHLSSLTPSSYGRRAQHNNTVCTSNSIDIYGTYRRKRDDEVCDVGSSRQHIYDLSTTDLSDKMSGVSVSYSDHPYTEQETVRLNDNPLLNRIANSLDTEYEHMKKAAKSSSPTRRISGTDTANTSTTNQYAVKPQRPKTLNVTPEHGVAGPGDTGGTTAVALASPHSGGSHRSYTTNKTFVTSHHKAFTNSNTSSSSPSPASTPSPKLVYTPVDLADINATTTTTTTADNNNKPSRSHVPHTAHRNLSNHVLVSGPSGSRSAAGTLSCYSSTPPSSTSESTGMSTKPSKTDAYIAFI